MSESSDAIGPYETEMPRGNCVVMLEAHLDAYPEDPAPLARGIWQHADRLLIARSRRASLTHFHDPMDVEGDPTDLQTIELLVPPAEIAAAIPSVPTGRWSKGLHIEQKRRLEFGISRDYRTARDPYSPRVRLHLEFTKLETSQHFEATDFPDVFASIFEAIDATGLCSQGYIDATWAWETSGGWLSNMLVAGIPPFPFKRTMEQLDARNMLLPGKRDRVFGSFWAHYLRPELAARLDPDGTFIERFLAVRDDSIEPGEGTQTATKYPSGGLFLTISGTPADLAPQDGACGTCTPWYAAALWLRQEFREKGLL